MAKSNIPNTDRAGRLLGIILLCSALLTAIAVIGFNPFDWPAGGHPEEISNPLKHFGAVLALILVNFTFGRWGSLSFVLIILVWCVYAFKGERRPWNLTLKFLGWGLMTGWLIHFLSKFYGHPLPDYMWGAVSGGISKLFIRFTGFTGAWIFTTVTLLALIEYTLGFRFLQFADNVIRDFLKSFPAVRLSGIFKRKHAGAGRRSDFKRQKRADVIENGGGETENKESSLKISPNRRKMVQDRAESPLDEAEELEEYRLPSIEFLTAPEEDIEVPEAELRASAKALEERLAEFGVEARVVEINPGPVITRFDLQPAPGVKINRIVSLQDDLALSMRARSMRILAPIPGEAAVGVEVPNRRINIVRLRTQIESEAYRKSKSVLTVALGVDTNGNPYIANLQEMPHLLVAGTTGSGKSVCLNSILMSILYKAKPEEVRLALVDPKKLELSLYIPLLEHHLITSPNTNESVVTKPENALKLMKSLEFEMERRYEQLSVGGYRSLEEYNRPRQIKEPFIVVVIDELADLMITAGGSVEAPIARLAQMGRAVGIHLIVATQRPSVDVLTGVIKANFPCRIAFQVPTKVDSRTILDANGAETLLGKGDMLFIPPGSGKPIRIHGSFVDSKEVSAVVEHISRQPAPVDKKELPDPNIAEETATTELDENSRDELFEEAARLIAVHQQGSVSLLQRRLKVGYARAARMIDQLEMAGIVGPFDGSKARKVLVDENYIP